MRSKILIATFLVACIVAFAGIYFSKGSVASSPVIEPNEHKQVDSSEAILANSTEQGIQSEIESVSKDYPTKKRVKTKSIPYESLRPSAPNLGSLYNDYLYLKAKYETTKSAESASRLSQVLYACVGVASVDVELEANIQNLTNQQLLSGKDNGVIVEVDQNLRARYEECRKLASIIGGRDFKALSIEYLYEAAEMGDPNAVTQLAMGILHPEDFNSWNTSEKNAYREKIGQNLLAARALCHPGAFTIFANQTSQGEYWIDVSDDPPRISQYANHWALGMIYTNVVENFPERRMQAFIKKQEKIAQELGLTSDEIREGKEYGYRLYQQSCKKNN